MKLHRHRIRLFAFVLFASIFRAGTHSRAELFAPEIVVRSQAACRFTLDSLDQVFPPTGGTGSVSFTASDPQCSWMARSNAPWITIISATSGAGSGMVKFSVRPAVGARVGTLIVAGRVFTVRQEFYPCAGAPNFAGPRLFPTVAAPGKFLSEDFNGDGLDDLVFLSSFSQSSRLTLSLGVAGAVGGFAAPTTIAPGLVFPAPSPAFGAGDLNEDGKLDLVLAGGGADSRVILLAGDGPAVSHRPRCRLRRLSLVSCASEI